MFNPYARMYDATMIVRRWQDVEKDGYIRHELVHVSEDRPCRYSSSGQTSTGAPDPSIQVSHRLFCSLEEDVQEGDRVRVTLRAGKEIELTLGECHPYTYQWQCEAKRDEEA